MSKTCLSCHEPQAGIMMGFADNLSIKAKILQIDLGTHKDYVKFNNSTRIVNLKSFKDIRNYFKTGFSVTYHEINGEKIASEIHRFDISSSLDKKDKINKKDIKRLKKISKGHIFDVRPPINFVAGHIPEATMLPATEFDRLKNKLPQNTNEKIVLYGDNNCFGLAALIKAQEAGYTNAKVYADGYKDWISTEYGVTEPHWLRSAILNGLPHVLFDLRNEDEIRQGHIKDTLHITPAELSSGTKKLPTLPDAPIIFYGPQSPKTALQALAKGYKNIHILSVNFNQWKIAGNPVEKGQAKLSIINLKKPKPGTISIEQFEHFMGIHSPKHLIIDVRNANEFSRGNIPGSINISADIIGRRLDIIPKDKELLLYCNTGILAEIAHNILDKKQYKNRYLNAVVTFEDGEIDIDSL